jgi:hypothetical protein
LPAPRGLLIRPCVRAATVGFAHGVALRFRPPRRWQKTIGEFAAARVEGATVVFAVSRPRGAHRPPGLNGSPAPSRGCQPGPPGAGSTMPRPPPRGPGRLRPCVHPCVHRLRNRSFPRQIPPSAPDCKSAIVGSTPTGASFLFLRADPRGLMPLCRSRRQRRARRSAWPERAAYPIATSACFQSDDATA